MQKFFWVSTLCRVDERRAARKFRKGGQAESTENYECCITVPRNFVQDCSSQKIIDLTPVERTRNFFPSLYCVTGPMNMILIKLGVLRERVAKWRGHSPLSNVAQVRILASTAYGGWVCCWFSPLLLEVFLRVLRFPPLLKTNTCKFQFDLELTDTFQRVHMNLYVLRGYKWQFFFQGQHTFFTSILLFFWIVP